MKKLYASHQWVSPPDKNGNSFFGISQYAKEYFLRFHRVDCDSYPKTNYCLNHVPLISLFLQKNAKRIQNEDENFTKAEQIQIERFRIKKGEAFAKIQTYEFDLELSAPVDMWVKELEFEIDYRKSFLTSPYIFEVQCLKPSQLKTLQTEEEYSKSTKFFEIV